MLKISEPSIPHIKERVQIHMIFKSSDSRTFEVLNREYFHCGAKKHEKKFPKIVRYFRPGWGSTKIIRRTGMGEEYNFFTTTISTERVKS